jgi:hypothetical protein
MASKNLYLESSSKLEWVTSSKVPVSAWNFIPFLIEKAITWIVQHVMCGDWRSDY